MSQHQQDLDELEQTARQLEPGDATRGEMFEAVRAYAEQFLQNLVPVQAYRPDPGLGQLADLAVRETPTEIETVLEELQREVDTPGINPASGGHVGYIPGGGVYPSALGDYLADVTNRYSGVSFASPGAVRMERALVDWMAGLVGLPDTAGGDLTSGGSTANLSAIVTAREAHGIRARDIEQTCIYMTAQVHHCVDKALRVAGLQECRKRNIPMDDAGRMHTGELQRSIGKDIDKGLSPWMVVASAGTTYTGVVDPLPDIADLCAEYDLWFHIDAAYGGFFLLCEQGAKTLAGIDRADSVVMDPHKGLFLPYGSGAVLVRDVKQLATAHSYEADYMQDARETHGSYSPADLSVELSRPFRGLRLWMPLKLFGLAPFRAALAEKLELARYFHHKLSALPGFETGPEPDLSVVTYRYMPEKGDADDFNRKLLRALHNDGRVFVSSTLLEGRFVLRLAVLNFRTHRDTIDLLLTLLRDNSRELERDQR
jgi:glutamate/tyrosine decarboxylase-like PLP-dependent enzyme